MPSRGSPRETVRVAVIGDKGVGKSSLILAAAKKNLSDTPIPTLHVTRVELQDTAVSHAECLCHDTDSTEEEQVREQLRRCNVVLICFAMDKPETMANALKAWLPLALASNKQAQILLIGCKRDVSVMTDADTQELHQRMASVINIVRLEECSAKDDTAAAAFAFACDAYLHPISPIFDHVKRRIRSRAVRAFTRIFELCDEDSNGALNPSELRKFHLFAWGRLVADDELRSTRTMLLQNRRQQDKEPVTTEGVTHVGFIELHMHMVVKERLDLVWRMLFMFGYDRSLNLAPGMFASVSQHSETPNIVCQLSKKAVEFLTAGFRLHAALPESNGSGAEATLPLALLLEDSGPRSFFHNAPPATTPAGHALGAHNIKQELLLNGLDHEHLTLDAYLAMWAYYTLIDARKALAAILYLGFPDTYERGQEVMQSWQRDLSARQPVGTQAASNLLVQTHKHTPAAFVARPDTVGICTYSSLLFGSEGSGKMSCLEFFAGCKPQDSVQSPPTTAVRLLPATESSSAQALILVAVSQSTAHERLASLRTDSTALTRLLANDMLLFGFGCGSQESCVHAHDLMVALSDQTHHSMPSAFVSLHAELGLSDSVRQEVAACAERLQVQHLSGMGANASCSDAIAFGRRITALMQEPSEHIALTPARAQQQERVRVWQRNTRYAAYCAAGVGGVAMLVLVVRHQHSRAASASKPEDSVKNSAGKAGSLASQSLRGSAPVVNARGGEASGLSWWTWKT